MDSCDISERKKSFSELVSQFATEVTEAYLLPNVHKNGVQTLPTNLNPDNCDFLKLLKIFDDDSGSCWSDEDQLSDAPVAPIRTESIKITDVEGRTNHELHTSFHIWYQPDLSRENAEDLLIRQPVGTFYIRNSSRENYHALSVHISLVDPRVEHYLVHDKGNCLQMDSSNLEFPNFVELLSFFTKSNTYSATTGIPVQLKIPRLISSSACSSVYDKISLQEPRIHSQSKDVPISRDISITGNKAISEQKTERRHSYNSQSQKEHKLDSQSQKENKLGNQKVVRDGDTNGNSGNCSRGFNSNGYREQTDAERPKSVYAWNCSEVTIMRDTNTKGIAPPKPPKPKNYRGNNFAEEDLIYINLDKSPDKDMINIMSGGGNGMIPCLESANGMIPCLESANGMTPYLESSNDEEVDTKNVKNMHLNKHKGPAIFYAPPPPSSSPTDKIAEFIAPSPPCTPPSDESEVDENDITISLVSLHSNKNSLSNESLRMKRTNPRPVSVMEKVRSRVFKMERSSRQSVRAKLCNKLSNHILRLTDSHDFTFAARCSTFVTFVKQQHESKPDRLLLQIREFMCNLKHEMITYRHETLEDILSRAQRKRPPPKLNDIVEGVLVKAVIFPLRTYIAKVLLDFDQDEAAKLKNSMTIALSKSMEELGVNKDLFCGQDIDWTTPVEYLRDITNHYSPIKKLERLLACVNAIYTIIRDINLEATGKPLSMGADEFLPLFIYVLALSSVGDIGQELLFIQGLLDPPLLIGEPGYYLTTLASSIMLLQSLDFEKSHKILPTVGHLQSMLQIYFTDSDMEQIAYKTLPIHQNTTIQDLLETLAAKFRIDDISEYGLYKVEDGTEVRLEGSECPQYIKNRWLVESLERDINAFFTFHKQNR